MQLNMWPDFEKPTKMSHLVFRELPILNFPAIVALLYQIVAMHARYTV